MAVVGHVGNRAKPGRLGELSRPWRNCVRQGLFLRRVAYIIARGNADLYRPRLKPDGGNRPAAELLGATVD